MKKNYLMLAVAVVASSMSRTEYHNMRGFDVPSDDDEGYLVEYPDKPATDMPEGINHYITWKPREIFEAESKLIGEPQSKVEFSHIQTMASTLTYTCQRIGESTVTVCCAFLPNGFQVGTGESACVDPANYNQETGEKYAKERAEASAINKLWELEGYLLAVTGSTSDKL